MTTMSMWARAGSLSDEIRAEARKVDPVKTAFTLLMVPFVVTGYVLAYAARAVWAVATFVWVALLVGWRRAGGPQPHRGGGS